ncbi:twin-arginine translocase subunit TatC [Desulfovibrio sp.]|uniref:twin-arginine translocase subunit TatC n=1 Tax=Desulfovibrio sp. TaxID=885 RepID=UPI0025C233F5|nr:twin-arginine translocase subunit TatC [Desulfovibrio sp.]
MTEEKKVPLEQAAASTSDASGSEESGAGPEAAAALSVIGNVNLEAASHLAASAAPDGGQAENRAEDTPDNSAPPAELPAQDGMKDPAGAAHAPHSEDAPQANVSGQDPGQTPDQDSAENADTPVNTHAAGNTVSAEAAAETLAEPAAAPAAAAGSGGQPPLPPASPFPPNASEEPAPVPAVSGGQPPATPDEDDDEEESGPDKPMGLMDHLGELRMRLVRCCIAVIVGFFACWAVVDPIFDVLVNPLLAVLPKGSHAIYTTLPEGFFTRMHIAFVAGVFVSSPVIFYQIWSFIAPGLYEEEKKYIIPIAVMSALFFICGGAFCYFVVFPYAFNFFVSFATEEIVAMPKVSDYLSFVLKLILAFGIIFEMPLFAFFLARMGVVTAAMMRQVRRYAILGIFIVAAILTPPDVVSQLLMACPMLILYEISIWVAAAFGRKPKTEKDADDGGQNKADADAASDAKTANASEKA